MGALQKLITMTTGTPSKALLIRINFVFLALFLVIYTSLLLRSSTYAYRGNAAAVIGCSLGECHDKVDKGIEMKAVLEDNGGSQLARPKRKMIKRKKPSFANEMGWGLKIGMVNVEEEDLIREWEDHGQIIPIRFEPVSKYLEWKDLFPEWIDEEEENEGYLCPQIPMPDFEDYGYLDLIVAKVPCKFPEEGWRRDVFRLQVHLIAAKMAVERGRRRGGRTRVVVLSKCRPIMELFRCDDLVGKEGDRWLFGPEMGRLEHKVSLPFGSCNLALPLWAKGL